MCSRWMLLISLCLASACSFEPASESEATSAITTSSVTATLTLQSQWSSGYCANVVVSNGANVAQKMVSALGL